MRKTKLRFHKSYDHRQFFEDSSFENTKRELDLRWLHSHFDYCWSKRECEMHKLTIRTNLLTNDCKQSPNMRMCKYNVWNDFIIFCGNNWLKNCIQWRRLHRFARKQWTASSVLNKLRGVCGGVGILARCAKSDVKSMCRLMMKKKTDEIW